MYRAGKRHRSRRKLIFAGVLLTAALVYVLAVTVVRLLKPHTVLGPAPKAVTTTISDEQKTKTINEPLFSLQLPTDWQATGHTLNPYNQYIWHNTAEEPGMRQLTVFVDTIPSKFALNRFLAVGAQGDKLQQLSDLSDNCANFTEASKSSKATGVATSKWNGLTFLCDVGNYGRNVVGIGSAGELNSVTLNSADHGKHRFFITFTDNSPQPDYGILYTAINSFTLK